MSQSLFNLTALSLLGTTGVCCAGFLSGLTSLLAGEAIMGGLKMFTCAGVGLYCVRNYMSRFESAEPNEYLLVIQNGKQIAGTVGLVHFRQAFQICKKFPSNMNNITFKAEQVTREIQGVGLKGFCTWSVFRESDGPYRAYKSFDGFSPTGLEDANSNIRQLVESVLRNLVSSITIEEVLTQRQLLREKCKEEVLQLTQGWGIWIETIEITDVRISSNSLFTNMQAEFRQATKLKAEKIKMGTDQELNDRRREFEVENAKAAERAATQKQEIQLAQQLQREQRQFSQEQEKHKIRVKRLAQDTEYKKVSLEQDKEYKIANVQQDTEYKIAQAEQDKEYKISREHQEREFKVARAEEDKEFQLANIAAQDAVQQEQQRTSQALELARKEHERNMDELQNHHKREQNRANLEVENAWTDKNFKLKMMNILLTAVKQVKYDMRVVNTGGSTDLQDMIPGMASLWKTTMDAVQ